MFNMQEIAWLGGLLEGEGYFTLKKGKYPTIRLGMTAEDTVRRAAAMWDSSVYHYGNMWITQIFASSAISWMLTLYSFLNKNRRSIIVEAVKFWRENSCFLIPTCHPDRKVYAFGLCKLCYMKEYREKKKLLEVA